ncbi:MAG: alpha/beta hydrolase family protein [Luteolibacter sp.]
MKPFLCLGLLVIFAKGEDYDPMSVTESKVVSERMEVRDIGRERVLPIRVYFPGTKGPAPVIIFSHGLGGSCDASPYLGEHWALRGYCVVFVQHPGSDEEVWKNLKSMARMGAMKQAASGENFLARVADIPVVIDALSTWNVEKGHVLFERMDLDKIGISGHSFGAKTTQAVAGQSFLGQSAFLEKRLDAALMMSPSPPRKGDLEAAFATVNIPCMLMTGTLDESRIGGESAEDRLKVFPNLKHAAAWQVVFHGARHSSFGQREDQNAGTFHPAILGLSTAFWDANLRRDAEAMAWLNGKGASAALGSRDVWEMNVRAKE